MITVEQLVAEKMSIYFGWDKDSEQYGVLLRELDAAKSRGVKGALLEVVHMIDEIGDLGDGGYLLDWVKDQLFEKKDGT